MQYIKLSDILELKSPYKELIEMEANRIKEATGGVVVPEDFDQRVEEQNHRIYLKLGCSKEFANVLGEVARCRAADLTRDEDE
jgi:hypothetical protein